MIGFALISVGLLVAVAIKRRTELQVIYSLAISADFYSVIANSIGVGYGFWSYPERWFPEVFRSSVVYDLLFFPAMVVTWVAWLPESRGKKVVYTLAFVMATCTVEYWLESRTDLIEYGRGWMIYKTFGLYLVTNWVFYWLYRWLKRGMRQ